jgi:hypothetical protein
VVNNTIAMSRKLHHSNEQKIESIPYPNRQSFQVMARAKICVFSGNKYIYDILQNKSLAEVPTITGSRSTRSRDVQGPLTAAS